MPCGFRRPCFLTKTRSRDVPSEREKLCALGRAISIPDRVRILALLKDRSMNLNEISNAVSLPPYGKL